MIWTTGARTGIFRCDIGHGERVPSYARTDASFRGRHVWRRPVVMREGVEPMGRGRAKAKQQKVAGELKYSSHNTALDQPRRELAGKPSDEDEQEFDDPDEDEERGATRR